MEQNDKVLIDKLFDQLGEAARKTTNRDAQADQYIRRRVQQQPELLYNMIQTLIMQQAALKNAKTQVEQLQQQTGVKQAAPPQKAEQPTQGKSFLAGAAETAVGVAGGIFLADAVDSIIDDIDLDLAADDIEDAYEEGVEDGLDLDDALDVEDFDFDF